MGLRINTNVLSLNAQRNLAATSKALGKALERLSSGSRINRAGDDAAGLAISEGLQSQVRGLRVAVRNSNDAIGFLNTAEGALNEITNITQRLRELAIQAANGTLGVTDRSYLNDEKNSLIAEFNRIATQTGFNGVSLLDGSFQTTDLQVGVNKGETISFTIGDARASSLGALATISGFNGAINTSIDTTTNAVSINGIALAGSTTTDDTVSVGGKSFSAIAIARRINEKQSQTNVKAEVEDTVIRIADVGFSLAANSFGGGIAAGFKINNVTISGTGIGTAQKFIDVVNAFSNATGVKARLSETNTGTPDIELYAEDGRNISLTTSVLGGIFTSTQGVSGFEYALFGGQQALAAVLSAAASLGGGFLVQSQAVSAFSLGLGVGGLSDNVRTGAVKLISSKAIVVTGSNASVVVGFGQGNTAVDAITAINTIDLTTAALASNALATVDSTLQQVTALRASLGAVQNRLESTSNNIGVTLENISSARSQIRDADIATETAELTRAQILQQAGVAVLGQANASSQVALSLLKF